MDIQDLALELTKAVVSEDSMPTNDRQKAKAVVALYISILKELKSKTSN